MTTDDRAKFEALTDEQIIAIKKSTKCSDPYKPWGDTLAFARSILASAQAASAEPVARMPPLLNANDLSTNFCAKWSGAQKVEAGDILDWIMQQPLYTTPAPAVAPAAVTEAEKVSGMICQPDGLKFDAFGEPRKRYVRVTLDGSHCVMRPSEGDTYVKDARESGDESPYVVADVWLSEREFDDLGEFNGF